MNTSNINFSRDSIAAAVQAGERGRQQRIEETARSREEGARLLVKVAPQRAAEILSNLPQLITTTIALVDETPQSIVVMWVEPHEYAGQTECILGLRYRGPHQGQQENLKLAARQVFDALADLNPELTYRSKDETLFGKAQLAISIRLG